MDGWMDVQYGCINELMKAWIARYNGGRMNEWME